MKQIRFKVHSVCIFFMFLLMLPLAAVAQEGMITGQVVDEKGESIIGATVQVRVLRMVQLPILTETFL